MPALNGLHLRVLLRHYLLHRLDLGLRIGAASTGAAYLWQGHLNLMLTRLINRRPELIDGIAWRAGCRGRGIAGVEAVGQSLVAWLTSALRRHILTVQALLDGELSLGFVWRRLLHGAAAVDRRIDLVTASDRVLLSRQFLGRAFRTHSRHRQVQVGLVARTDDARHGALLDGVGQLGALPSSVALRLTTRILRDLTQIVVVRRVLACSVGQRASEALPLVRTDITLSLIARRR